MIYINKSMGTHNVNAKCMLIQYLFWYYMLFCFKNAIIRFS